MKKYILSLLALGLVGTGIQAQGFDVDPVLKLNRNELQLKAGGRMVADAAYYKTDFTNMKSGADLVDARVRAGLTYKNWDFFADFGFASGKFSQKDIFLKYTFDPELVYGNQSIKAGYYNEPSSMANSTSSYSYHFISRATSASLQPRRSLGISYKFFNDIVMLNQGVFAENKYNDQLKGFQGGSVSGRWLVRPLNDEFQTFHLGISARYARLNTGDMDGDVLKTNLAITSPLGTNVDDTREFMNAQIPWAKNVVDFGVEALYKNPYFFLRGEYLFKIITKDRDDEALFHSQLGGSQSWTTLESWKNGNPLGSSHFQGGYVEMGYQILGDGYRYSNENGLIEGNNGRALEVVARYNYTQLNDIRDGDFFLYGKKKFYPGGVIKDYPATAKSIGGGELHSATVGLNYAFNKYAQVMFDYTYNRLNSVYYPDDKNFHTFQGRVMFTF